MPAKPAKAKLPKLAVIDVHYRDGVSLGPGASYVRWELEQAGVQLVRPSEAEYVLTSVQSERDIDHLLYMIRNHNITGKIILGGPGCYAPWVYAFTCEAAVVGEGMEFVQTMINHGIEAALELPCVWRPGRTVVPSLKFPWHFPPAYHQDGTVRVWFSRGCRNKCLFCQTGWERKYARHPNPEIAYSQASALLRAGHDPVLVTNDASELDYSRPVAANHYSGTMRGFMKLLSRPGRQVKSLRVGIEGVSERLRKAVLKPLDNKQIVWASTVAAQKGTLVRWYFIAGLPGETDEDWEELRDLFMEAKRCVSRGVIMANFHAFYPMSAAPLGLLPVTDEYWERWQKFREWFMAGAGYSRQIQIRGPSKPETRMKIAKASMAASEEQIRKGWADKDPPNWCVKYVGTPQRRRHLAARYAALVGLDWPDTETEEGGGDSGEDGPTD